MTARAITRMFRSTPEGPLVREASLIPAKVLLDTRQKRYCSRLLSLPDGHLTKEILLVTMRKGDRDTQPDNQPLEDIEQAKGRGPQSLGSHLARQLAVDNSINPAEGVEPVVESRPTDFPGEIYIQETKLALETAAKTHLGLVLQTDRSRLDYRGARAGVAWKSIIGWQAFKTTLGSNKEIFNAELQGISDALGIALKEAKD